MSDATGQEPGNFSTASLTQPASSSADLKAANDSQASTPVAGAGRSTPLRRKAGAFLRRPLAEKLWIVPAFLLLGMSRFVLLIIPFPRIAPLLGRDMKAHPIACVASAGEISRALAIGRAIRMAARYTPWQSTCLTQAIAARMLLGFNGLPYVLHLGVRLATDSSLMAHAWVSTGSGSVTGGHGTAEYKVLGTFVSPGLVPPGKS